MSNTVQKEKKAEASRRAKTENKQTFSPRLIVNLVLLTIFAAVFFKEYNNYTPQGAARFEQEGDRVVQALAEYKSKNDRYPESLERLNVETKYYLHYSCLSDGQDFDMFYAPVWFDPLYKLSYEPQKGEWQKMN